MCQTFQSKSLNFISFLLMVLRVVIPLLATSYVYDFRFTGWKFFAKDFCSILLYQKRRTASKEPLWQVFNPGIVCSIKANSILFKFFMFITQSYEIINSSTSDQLAVSNKKYGLKLFRVWYGMDENHPIMKMVLKM